MTQLLSMSFRCSYQLRFINDPTGKIRWDHTVIIIRFSASLFFRYGRRLRSLDHYRLFGTGRRQCHRRAVYGHVRQSDCLDIVHARHCELGRDAVDLEVGVEAEARLGYEVLQQRREIGADARRSVRLTSPSWV